MYSGWKASAGFVINEALFSMTYEMLAQISAITLLL